MYLANLELPKPHAGSARKSAGMTIIYEFRDSATNAPPVRYGQRRDLSRLRGANRADQVEHLEQSVDTALDGAGSLLRDALPANGSAARTALGCKGALGEARRPARDGR